jgi:hypothetical protein
MGAATALTLWVAEAVVVALVNADVGGLDVLLEIARPLARWGWMYVVLGAIFGGASGPRWWLAGVPWAVLCLFADRSIAPVWIYLGLVVVAGAIGPLWGLRRWARWVFVPALAALGFMALPRAGMPSGDPDDTRPDIVLIVIDTLRADHVGAYGYERDTTPVLDAFSETARRYTRARSTASWTLPSHASLFTGLRPSEHGATASSPVLPPQPTLASRLSDRGYRTVGLSTNGWVSGGTGLDQGFQTFRFTGDDGVASQLLLPLALTRPIDLGGAATTRGALEALALDGPVFLFLNYLEAHEPLGTLPDEDLNHFVDTPLDPTLGRVWIRDMARFWCACDGPAGELGCKDGHPVAPDARIQGSIDRYDAGIRYVDREIGKVLAAVDDDAIVVITSDHGELLGEYDGRLGHMVTLEPELIDIPLFVRAPGIAPGTDDRPTSLADVHGMILALADGKPLPTPKGWVVSESHPHQEHVVSTWEALFGCDCSTTQNHRRAVWNGVEDYRLDSAGQPPEDAMELLTLPFADGTDAVPENVQALEALGYVQ